MIPLRPLAALPTHEVTNMPPHLGDQDLWGGDAALRDGVEREGGGRAANRLAVFGRAAGAAETFEKADLANRHPPELRAFDRYGMRIDQVAFHPAWHDLMGLAIGNEVPSFAWKHPGPGAHVAHGRAHLPVQPGGGRGDVPDGDDLLRGPAASPGAGGGERVDPEAPLRLLRPPRRPGGGEGRRHGGDVHDGEAGRLRRARQHHPGGGGGRGGPGGGGAGYRVPADRAQVLLLGPDVRTPS